MENTEAYYLTLIEKYFNLDLSESELKIVEEKLLTDSSFTDLYNLYKESNELVNNTYQQNSQTKSYSEIAEIISKENEIEKSKSISLKNMFYAVAACMALLIVSILILETSSDPDIELLSKNAWDKNMGLDNYTIRNGSRDSIKTVFLSAFDAYKQKEYQESIDILINFNSNDLYYEDALLIRGLSQYHLENNNAAIKTLEKLMKFPTGKKANVARWYLGLIHIDNKNLDDARKYLVIPEGKQSEIKLIE